MATLTGSGLAPGRLVFLGILLCWGGVAHADVSLLRSTLIVGDVARSLQWYSALGFTVEEELGGPRNPEGAFPLASRSSGFRLVVLAPPAGRGGRVGLLEFFEPAPPRVQPATAQVGIGSLVLVIESDDARALFTTLQAKGAELLTSAPTKLRRVSAEGEEGVGYVFHVRDPDGTLIEVLQPPVPTR